MRRWLWLWAVPLFLQGEMQWTNREREGFSIALTLSPEELTVSHPLSLQAIFHYPKEYVLDAAALINTLAWTPNPLRPRVVIKQDSLSCVLQTDEEGNHVQTLTALIEPLISGTLPLSFLTVSFTAPQAVDLEAVNILTPVFEIAVHPFPKFNLEEPLPIGPLLPLEPQFPLDLTEANRHYLSHPARLEEEKQRNERLLSAHTFPWLSALTLLVLFAGGWLIQKDRQIKRQRAAEKKRLTPKQKAHRSLEALRKQLMAKQGHFKEFYPTLTRLVLDYVEERLSFKLTSYTTSELQSVLSSSSLPQALTASLMAFLSQADQVKFAGFSPSLLICQLALTQAQDLIDKGESLALGSPPLYKSQHSG